MANLEPAAVTGKRQCRCLCRIRKVSARVPEKSSNGSQCNAVRIGGHRHRRKVLDVVSPWDTCSG
jgi:hypothetical protein